LEKIKSRKFIMALLAGIRKKEIEKQNDREGM